MKLVYLENTLVPQTIQVTEFNSDETIEIRVDCAGTVFAGSATINALTTYETIVVCNWIDSSNFCVRLPAPGMYPRKVIEIYPIGGSITIFSQNAGGSQINFLDGSSSISTTMGVRFRSINGSWGVIG